jgi:anaerobic selenocysteine-containing dehydrogenase
MSTEETMMDGAATMDAIRTACPYCGVGCGVLATPDGAGGVAIAGDTHTEPVTVMAAVNATAMITRVL